MSNNPHYNYQRGNLYRDTSSQRAYSGDSDEEVANIIVNRTHYIRPTIVQGTQPLAPGIQQQLQQERQQAQKPYAPNPGYQGSNPYGVFQSLANSRASSGWGGKTIRRRRKKLLKRVDENLKEKELNLYSWINIFIHE